jgi:hypothetical protein
VNGERSEVRSEKSDLSYQLSAIDYPLSIELHIEELVLHGFAPGDRCAIGDAVERELTRLLGEQRVPSLLRSENATDEIKGATFNVVDNSKPLAIGHQVARAVYQGFGK